MSGFCWRLMDIVSKALEPDERDAVRGISQNQARLPDKRCVAFLVY